MIRINAGNLGELRLKNFCPRCFYLRYHCPVRSENPYYSPMAGILSILDSYIKRVVNEAFRRERSLPEWMRKPLNDLEIVEALVPKREKALLEDIEISGQPDAIWRLKDSSVFIVDYKTSQFGPSQEAILPLYEAQLNAYSYLMEMKGETVSGLALIYLQPRTYKENNHIPFEVSKTNLTLHFDCAVKLMDKWKREEIESLLMQAGRVLSLKEPPPGREGCNGCRELDEWLEVLYPKAKGS